jgi:hypothetical protein
MTTSTAIITDAPWGAYQKELEDLDEEFRYQTLHPNGKVIFSVIVRPGRKRVDIHLGPRRPEQKPHFTFHNVPRVFVSEGNGPNKVSDMYQGNTLLIETRVPLQYAYVTSEKVDIIETYSPVQHFTPSYAVDEHQYAYLFVHGFAVQLPDEEEDHNPEDYFRQRQILSKRFQNIHHFQAGPTKIAVYADANPELYYHELMSFCDDAPLEVEYDDRTRKQLSYEEFVSLLKQFNEHMGFYRIKYIGQRLITPRDTEF